MSEAENQSGGVNISGSKINVGGDIVGRDKNIGGKPSTNSADIEGRQHGGVNIVGSEVKHGGKIVPGDLNSNENVSMELPQRLDKAILLMDFSNEIGAKTAIDYLVQNRKGNTIPDALETLVTLEKEVPIGTMVPLRAFYGKFSPELVRNLKDLLPSDDITKSTIELLKSMSSTDSEFLEKYSQLFLGDDTKTTTEEKTVALTALKSLRLSAIKAGINTNN